VGTSRSRPVSLNLLARHRGAQFQVVLRAVKSGAGLVQTGRALAVGDKLILHVPDPRQGRAVVQLFATVARPYPDKQAYAMRWDKLVSPTGTVALMEFLQSTLGICFAPGTAMAEELVEGEMVYFDFVAQELHLPNRGAVVGRSSPSRIAALGENTTDFGTAPLTTGPVGRIETGRVGDTGPRELMPRKVESAAKKAALEAEAEGKPFYQEGEEVVELFGMKVSKDNWDRLENLQYTGTHHKDTPLPGKVASSTSGTPVAPRRTTDSQMSSVEDPAETDNKVSNFFRKIANRLADKD
jgi:hypothetical protein